MTISECYLWFFFFGSTYGICNMKSICNASVIIWDENFRLSDNFRVLPVILFLAASCCSSLFVWRERVNEGARVYSMNRQCHINTYNTIHRRVTENTNSSNAKRDLWVPFKHQKRPTIYVSIPKETYLPCNLLLFARNRRYKLIKQHCDHLLVGAAWHRHTYVHAYV